MPLAPAPTVQLKDSALTGVDPHLIAMGVPGGTASLPTMVRLGRISLKGPPPNVLKLSAYLDHGIASGGLPPSTNYRLKAAASIARMYLNDTYGDCVIAGKAHLFGVWTGNDSPDGVALATDAEILAQYHSFCGPGDNGCNISSVLNIIKSQGMTLGGKVHKIEDYVSVDWTNNVEVQAVQYLFGASCIGINLPQAWTENAVWDVPTTAAGAVIVGGHDVTPIDYDANGVYVASWGRIYLITWAAFQSKKWLEEMYAMLGVDWYNADDLGPNGVDVATLRADLAKLGGGTIPPIDPPPPPPPPPPGVVPDLIGKTWLVAKQTLQAASLQIDPPIASDPNLLVVSQSLPAGSSVPVGTAITVTLGSAPPPPPPPPPPPLGPTLRQILAAQAMACAALKAHNSMIWWPAIDGAQKACAKAVTKLFPPGTFLEALAFEDDQLTN